MHSDLATRRRVLLVAYQRYQKADRAWDIARQEMKSWFPRGARPNSSAIGNPGSPIRRLYKQRERAMLQLEAARLKLDVARQRLASRRQEAETTHTLFLTYTSRQ
ncbi:hypothetical protein SAMN05444000_12921 [Shimia gijangensis]|uniref:Uncharacterized protein n=1 Tax=Shimia gijangensis TaxID=1470563 RepID=A0A1M6SFK7_9RHOB|nr:hypothetical protein SAMN05444000_12921 [Shimia gijangensis]